MALLSFVADLVGGLGKVTVSVPQLTGIAIPDQSYDPIVQNPASEGNQEWMLLRKLQASPCVNSLGTLMNSKGCSGGY